MERKEEVKSFFSIKNNRILLVALFLLQLSTITFAQMKGGILLVEHPSKLEVFDNYKQSLNEEQELKLPPFIPMLIAELDLSQPLNPLRKVIISGKTYYLGIGTNKEITNIGKAGKTLILYGWKKFFNNKSVTLVSPKKITFPNNKTKTVKKGSAIKVLFSKGNRFLIKLINNNEYGFIYLSKKERKVLFSQKQKRIISESVKKKIKKAIIKFNNKLSSIIKALNSRYGKHKPIPYFEEKVTNNKLLFVFNQGKLKDYLKSVSSLKKKIEIILLGTEIKVYQKENELIIK